MDISLWTGHCVCRHRRSSIATQHNAATQYVQVAVHPSIYLPSDLMCLATVANNARCRNGKVCHKFALFSRPLARMRFSQSPLHKFPSLLHCESYLHFMHCTLPLQRVSRDIRHATRIISSHNLHGFCHYTAFRQQHNQQCTMCNIRQSIADIEPAAGIRKIADLERSARPCFSSFSLLLAALFLL